MIEPLYVVDTNALIWYLTQSKKLSQRATEIFIAAERGETLLCIPAMAMAEMYYANQKWAWFNDFTATYHAIKAKPYFRLVVFRARDVLDFDQDAPVPEMHDRIIAGVSRRLSAPLISSDPLIIQAQITTVEW